MMTRFTSFAFMAASLLLVSPSVKASDYITASPTGGFDLSQGKDYVVIYAPDEVITGMGSKIASDQNLDATQTKNSFLYWVTDWDSTSLTMINVEEDGVTNPYGGTDFLNMTPVYDWGTGQFTATTGNEYDLSMIDSEYILHMDLRDGGNAESQYKFTIGNTAKTGGTFDLAVNLDLGEMSGTLVGVGSMPHDGNWYCLDIPVSDLIDEDGDFGFDLSGFTTGITTCYTVGFNSPTCSVTTSKLLPGDEVKTYTITTLNSALSLGSVYFYKADSSASGISEVAVSSDEEADVYDVMGRRATMNTPGIYLVKTANGVKKVLKK